MRLAALALAQWGAVSQKPGICGYLFAGNLLLTLLNGALLYGGRIYRRNHPLDVQTAQIIESKRQKEKEQGRKSRKKNMVVYSLVGAFFLSILIGFHLGLASLLSGQNGSDGQKRGGRAFAVGVQDVIAVLREEGFETANVPTTYWFYEEDKLANVAAGVKGRMGFEFYEYTDRQNTDGVYNRISYDLAQDMEFSRRAEHETPLPGGGRLFSITQNGVCHFAAYQDNTAVYAYAPVSSRKIIEGILQKIGYC